MVTKYNIISARTDDALCESVQRSLAEGWQLHGPPFVVMMEEHYWIHQALIFPMIPSGTSDDLAAVENVINLCEKYYAELSRTYAAGYGLTIQRKLTDLQDVLHDLLKKGIG